MKQNIFFFLMIVSQCLFSQQTLLKTFETSLNEIEVSTLGLDEIKIVNSGTNKIEVSLYDENPNAHIINIQEENNVLKIGFELLFDEKELVFKKFITKRLYGASTIIKLPENKYVTLHGNHVDVLSESYQGDLRIYIDKGLVKLQKVQGNVDLKLFQGNVFASLSNVNMNIISNNGKIEINNTVYQKQYQKETKNSAKHFKLNSIKANVNLECNFR